MRHALSRVAMNVAGNPYQTICGAMHLAAGMGSLCAKAACGALNTVHADRRHCEGSFFESLKR